MKKSKAWCKHCGVSVDKIPYKTGNVCYKCQIIKQREKCKKIYWKNKATRTEHYNPIESVQRETLEAERTIQER